MSSEHDVSRRQFLNYTLTGVGGFMAAGMTLPMVRFAIDPLLKQGKGAGDFYDIGVKESDLTEEPQKKQFVAKDIKDGWYTFDQKKEVYVFKHKGEIYALSPICTHLGCLVHWSPEPPFPEEFECPCHGSRFTKTGVNIAGLPATAPLHRYDVKVKDGKILIGNLHTRENIPAVPPKY
ncbi:MAG TPA: ubiquinol-cytochrome c reductase iron-sulfur subunit [Bacillales bacterium]|nr:ubiquinol-cytochrome c reductase iron-sulfur subunit [Bacillales bacterium]